MKILTKNIFILLCSVNILFSQTTDSAVLYQEAINTVDGEIKLLKSMTKLFNQIASLIITGYQY